jgi:glucose/arabinose dehydrogenase
VTDRLRRFLAGNPRQARNGQPLGVRLAAGLVAGGLVAAVLAACGGGSPEAARSRPGAFDWVTVQVPAANASTPFNTPRRLYVPSGWKAEVWARVPDARMEVWTPDGRLLVSESDLRRVLELTPGPDPTSPPRKTVLVSGLTMPQGLAFDHLDGRTVLYVAESDELDRYTWNDNGTVGQRTIVVRGLPDQDLTGDDVHGVKGIAIGPDHTIYVTGGSANNNSTVDLTLKPERAVIFAVSPAGRLSVFATGVRNGEGLAFAPDRSLWTAINERDRIRYPFHRAYGGYADALGKQIQAYVNNHPPDEVAKLSPGRNVGWPYCDPDPDDSPGAQNTGFHYLNLPFDPDAQTNPDGRVVDCAKLQPLNVGLPAHSAPLGFNFLEETTMASPWSGGAVIATHGSWDREPQLGPAVLWLPWLPKSHTLAPAVRLISGFQLASGFRWGRTVDAVPGPGGDLYVTDDYSGTVYRVGPAA